MPPHLVCPPGFLRITQDTDLAIVIDTQIAAAETISKFALNKERTLLLEMGCLHLRRVCPQQGRRAQWRAAWARHPALPDFRPYGSLSTQTQWTSHTGLSLSEPPFPHLKRPSHEGPRSEYLQSRGQQIRPQGPNLAHSLCVSTLQAEKQLLHFQGIEN